MKILHIILAALAIGAGSLKAELSGEDLINLKGWLESKGFVYKATRDITEVTCYVWSNDEHQAFIYIPVAVTSLAEARTAVLVSYITFINISQGANEMAKKAYDDGYTNGIQRVMEYQSQARKALPVVSK